MTQRKPPNNYAAAYVNLFGQIGCLTGMASLIIIGIAFAAGRFLDNYFDIRGVFTVLFLVGSFPVTLYVILRIALSTAARAQDLVLDVEEEDENKPDEQEEEIDS